MKRSMLARLALSSFFVSVPGFAHAQTPCTVGQGAVSGTPDCNFGGTGLVTTQLPGRIGFGTALVGQPDGKIVVVGRGYPSSAPQGGGYNWYVLRYSVDGTLDPTFANGGIAEIPVTPQLDYEHASAVTLQSVGSDTRILVAGSVPLKNGGNPQFGVAIVRLLSSGAIDTGFGTNGRIQFGWSNKGDSWAYDIAVQCDGRILVVGRYGTDMAVARLSAGGTLDGTFGTGGKTIISLGKPYAGDTGGGGHALALQPFGGIQASGCPAEQRILVAGNRPVVSGTGTSRDMAVARLLPNGTLDSTFGSGGRVFIDIAGSVDYAWGVAVDAFNKIVISGYTNTGSTTGTVDFALARLSSNGVLDSSFGGGGKVTTDVGGGFNYSESILAIDSAGRIVVSGISQSPDGTVVDFTVLRYDSTGDLDPTFGTSGVATIDFGIGTAEENWGKLALDAVGRMIVAGSTDSSKLVAVTAINP
jgi:uncharacterized delta-60 repeat protein